ncbi:MAG: beta-glucuronidase [Opitutales bacterium]|nr:beta-glucuronidase [Opitutales bacterium]
MENSDTILQNACNRTKTCLNGKWAFIVDPYETGYRSHRNGIPHDQIDPEDRSRYYTYFQNRKPSHQADMVEYDFEKAEKIDVPGDWNHQNLSWKLYEGCVWYSRKIEHTPKPQSRYFLRFDAANYETHVYLNGEKVGMHLGGFDPFSLEVTSILNDGINHLSVCVNNRREPGQVPNMRTDWYNYGGITRDVWLIETPLQFIDDYQIQLDNENPQQLKGFVKLSESISSEIILEIPELGFKHKLNSNSNGYAGLNVTMPDFQKWSILNPKLYDVQISTTSDSISDRIGFRTIKVDGADILLNDQPIFLRGISCHEEIPETPRRAHSIEDAKYILKAAKELHCNFVRLAHYPHSENVPRLADEMGILLWEEIPVYWGIQYDKSETFDQAASQLRTLVNRDKNRASSIIWSVANETPVNESRTSFLKRLKSIVTEIDTTRIVSAALDRDELDYSDKLKKEMHVSDPFAPECDVLCCNEYLGWYSGTPDQMEAGVKWFLDPNKPFIISEFGADALGGHRGDRMQRWTEDFQDYVYEQQLKMLDEIPTLRGMSPWILFDFRTPRRNLAGIQDGWNRKGLLSDKRIPKLAFERLKKYYQEKAKVFPDV